MRRQAGTGGAERSSLAPSCARRRAASAADSPVCRSLSSRRGDLRRIHAPAGCRALPGRLSLRQVGAGAVADTVLAPAEQFDAMHRGDPLLVGRLDGDRDLRVRSREISGRGPRCAPSSSVTPRKPRRGTPARG